MINSSEKSFLNQHLTTVVRPQSEDAPPDAQAAPIVSRYRLLSGNDLRQQPAQAWRVKYVFPEKGLCAIYGPSGSGKSFFGPDMGLAIAEGTHWFGFKTVAAPVVYVILEGSAGFWVRLQAWERANGRPIPANFHVVSQGFALVTPQDVSDLAAAIPSGAVVFIDTMSRAAGAEDENSSPGMSQITAGAERLHKLIGGLVVLVHHTGKDITRGMRGHNSLFAALDAAIEIKRKDKSRSWLLTKSRDSIEGNAHCFTLQRHTLGLDADGDEISSCTVLPGVAPAFVQAGPRGEQQRAALSAIRDALRKSTTCGMAGCPVTHPCVKGADATAAVAAILITTDPHKRSNRANTLITQLCTQGHICAAVDALGESWVWVPSVKDAQSHVHTPMECVDIVDTAGGVEMSEKSYLDTVDTLDTERQSSDRPTGTSPAVGNFIEMAD